MSFRNSLSLKMKEWHPENILAGKNNSGQYCQYAVLVLNTKITWTPKLLLPLWSKANLRITVDGGTNQWFSWMEVNQLSHVTTPSPHFVTGDMDSIDTKTLEYLRDNHASSVIVTDDQNETDFTKALREIKTITTKNKTALETVIAVVDSAGRLDQIMANINTLFKAKSIINADLYSLANDSISWILTPGSHKIFIPEPLRLNESWCGLIPIGEQCKHVTTTGLKWDLYDHCLKFGELVSTSNTYADMPYVTIETDKSLLWSMGLNGFCGPLREDRI